MMTMTTSRTRMTLMTRTTLMTSRNDHIRHREEVEGVMRNRCGLAKKSADRPALPRHALWHQWLVLSR